MNKRTLKSLLKRYDVRFAYVLVVYFIINWIFSEAGIYSEKYSFLQLLVRSLIFAALFTGFTFAVDKYNNKKG